MDKKIFAFPLFFYCTPKYKNAAITALAAHAPAAGATAETTNYSDLLANWNYFRLNCVV